MSEIATMEFDATLVSVKVVGAKVKKAPTWDTGISDRVVGGALTLAFEIPRPELPERPGKPLRASIATRSRKPVLEAIENPEEELTGKAKSAHTRKLKKAHENVRRRHERLGAGHQGSRSVAPRLRAGASRMGTKV